MRGAVLLLLSLAGPARAQTHPTVAEHLVLGDSAHTALAPAQALQHYRAALAADSTNYAALWKAGRELVDIAKQVQGKDDSSKHLRDSLYTAARAYGEAAVRVNPTGADGHRSEEHTSELQSLAYFVCLLLLEKKKNLLN